MNEAQTSNQPRYYWALILLLALVFCFRSFSVWIGYDRSPLFPNNDEAVVLDPAFSVAQGQGLKAPSYPYNDLERFYAHYPPLYMLAQGLNIKLFGLSPTSVRAFGLIFYFLNGILFLGIVLLLRRRKFLDGLAVLVALLLYWLEPTDYTSVREARPEVLGSFFVLLGIYLTLAVKRTNLGWILGSLCLGLALATHLSLVPFYLIFLCLAAVLFYRRPFFLAGLALLPVALNGFLWLAVHGNDSIPAFLAFYRMYGCHTEEGLIVGFHWDRFFRHIQNRSWAEVMNDGGTAQVLIAVSCGVVVLRAILLRFQKQRNEKPWRLGFYAFALMMVLLTLLVQFKLGTMSQRTVILIPILILSLASAVSFIPDSQTYLRHATKVLLVIFALGFLTMDAAFLGRLSQQWEQRSPQRFETVLTRIPKGAKVAARPVFWYELIQNGFQPRIFGGGLPCGPDTPETLETGHIDWVLTIHDDEVPILKSPGWKKETALLGIQEFDLYERVSPDAGG